MHTQTNTRTQIKRAFEGYTLLIWFDKPDIWLKFCGICVYFLPVVLSHALPLCIFPGCMRLIGQVHVFIVYLCVCMFSQLIGTLVSCRFYMCKTVELKVSALWISLLCTLHRTPTACCMLIAVVDNHFHLYQVHLRPVFNEYRVPEQQGVLMTLKIVNFMSTYLSMIPFRFPSSFCHHPLLSQMFYRPQQWRRRAPCCLMVPSTAVLTSWGKRATAAQREAVSPPPMPPLRYCSPTASTSWLWTGQIPAGRLLSKPSRKWQTWATRWLTDALAVVRATLKIKLNYYFFCGVMFAFGSLWTAAVLEQPVKATFCNQMTGSFFLWNNYKGVGKLNQEKSQLKRREFIYIFTENGPLG